MSDGRRFAGLGRAPILLLLAVALLAGIAVVAVHPWRSDAADVGRRPASVQSLTLPGTASDAPPSVPATLRLPAGADRTAAAAVATYLRARSDQDARTSYALLTSTSRRSYPTEATWLEALPDLPAPGTFLITGAKPAAGGTEVSVDVRRTPVLNPFVGFVPAHAVEVYRAVAAGSAWRVDPEPVRAIPDLISDRTAAADVSAWLTRLAACDGAGAAALQVAPDLLGDDTLPGTICTSHARLRAGPAQPVMGGPSTAPFLAAYGPEIGSWGRLIPVTGPGQQLLVGVAPLGRSWRVFGIVSGGTG
jgi:hypothetical protein